MRREFRIAFVVASLFACGGEAASAARSERGRGVGDAGAAPRRVEVVRARSVAFDDQVAIAGTLAAQDSVVVKSKVPGRLASIEVDLGSVVRAGQLLAQVDPVDYRLRVEQAVALLAQAKANLGLSPDDERADASIDQNSGVRQAQATLGEARANFARSQALVEKKLIGRADFDAAQATLLRAESEAQRAREQVYQLIAVLKQRKAEVALARQALADATIRSPLDGIVQMRHASAGEFLAQGADVATVVRTDPLRLRVEVPEREAARIAVGQAVELEVDGRERSYSGQVARISPVLNQQSRTLVVEAEVPNGKGEGELKPGNFVRARIALGQSEPVVAVPARTLVVFAGIEKVIGIESGRAVEKPVRTGRRAGDLVEILSGLNAEEAVVLDPGTLQQGQPVTVAGEAASSSASVGAPERGARVE